MSQIKEPSEGEKAATANVLKNIANLIKSGLYFGHNAGFVQEALGFLENTANNMSPIKEEKTEGQITNGKSSKRTSTSKK